VEAAVWTERMVAALENGVKGGRWYSLMDKVYAPATLQAAWARVRANGGAAGVDGESIERFAAQAEHYLAELATALRTGEYRAQPVKRVEIPKGDGKTRPLGIPVVKDRIVQTAMKLVIEPIFEATFRPTSYGFRPGRSCHDALREVDDLIKEGHCYVVDADLKSYFDSIPHERLMQRVEERISDGPVLARLRDWLAQDILAGLERWTPSAGTPQGAVISPLLANIYLHPLDELMATLGHRMVRYADDFVVLCERREEAEAALAAISRWVAENGLSLHPDKTHVGDCRQPGDGFEFLGYRFEAGQRWVRKKSLARLKDGIRERTMRTRGDSLARIVSDLNPRLRGWFGYFKHAHRHIFADVDASCGGGCGRYCASRKSGPASADATLTICAGPRPSSRRLGCSPSRRPGMRRATPDEETTNWRAVCGKTARTVRRAGTALAVPDPYQAPRSTTLCET
jgi:RNA-directed DNA polymerase